MHTSTIHQLKKETLTPHFTRGETAQWLSILSNKETEIVIFFNTEAELIKFKNNIHSAYETYKRRNK